jgi:hypothetical protein
MKAAVLAEALLKQRYRRYALSDAAGFDWRIMDHPTSLEYPFSE